MSPGIPEKPRVYSGSIMKNPLYVVGLLLICTAITVLVTLFIPWQYQRLVTFVSTFAGSVAFSLIWFTHVKPI
jgi:hypothetical protein